VDGQPVAVRPEGTRTLPPDIHRERRHGVQEERLDVIPGDDRDDVGPKRGQPLLHPRERGVNAQD